MPKCYHFGRMRWSATPTEMDVCECGKSLVCPTCGVRSNSCVRGWHPSAPEQNPPEWMNRFSESKGMV